MGKFAGAGSITEINAVEIEVFVIGADTYVAVASHYDGSSSPTYILESRIYRWSGSAFQPVQGIATKGAMDFEYFEIGGSKYLAVANAFDGTTYLVNSAIYIWGGSSFSLHQEIATKGAADCEVFEILGSTFMAIAFSFDGTTRMIASQLYLWTGTSFATYEQLQTQGATDFEHVVISGSHFLFVANRRDDISWTSPAVVYKWSGTSFATYQTFSTSGASDWEIFTIGSITYAAVANSYPPTSSSTVYWWNTTSAYFELSGSLATTGARDLEFITVGGESFLVAANEYSGSSYEVMSTAFWWNGRSFATPADVTDWQFATRGARDIDFLILGGTPHLLIAEANADAAMTYFPRSTPSISGAVGTSPYQSLASVGASSVVSFQLGGADHLAVAHETDGSTTAQSSRIYRWTNGSFALLQEVPASGARDWAFFTQGVEAYLVVANSFNETTSSYSAFSRVYRWNPSADVFEVFQDLPTVGAAALEAFTNVDGQLYLAVASNFDGASRKLSSPVFRWVSSTGFVLHQAIPARTATLDRIPLNRFFFVNVKIVLFFSHPTRN
jgi:hypothetical protein